LGYLDERKLRKSGVDTTAFVWLAWLIPFYLWRRAKILGQKPAYFWVWLVMLILSDKAMHCLQFATNIIQEPREVRHAKAV
ncbi:hypothetical protein O5559_28715, partial [Escherichia coli]|nr:hypothetical protein [Escherichia coli]